MTTEKFAHGTDAQIGLIISIGGSSRFSVVNHLEEKYICSIEQKFKVRNKNSANRIKIGQYVLFTSYYGGNQAKINELLHKPAENKLWTTKLSNDFAEMYDNYVY
jgi:hypothetical protein